MLEQTTQDQTTVQDVPDAQVEEESEESESSESESDDDEDENEEDQLEMVLSKVEDAAVTYGYDPEIVRAWLQDREATWTELVES